MPSASGDRKRKTEAQSDIEAQLRLVIDTIPTAAWTALPDGSNAFVNRRWSEYTGLRGEDTAGMGWQAAFHPDDIGKHVERWCASMASGQPFENEARLRRAADGEYRWFLIRAAPLHDELGNVVRWYGIATDIEDRKRAEQALQRSEAYLAQAQKMSHTGSWAADIVNQRVIHSSEEHHRLFGFDPVGMPAWDVWVSRIHPDDRQQTMETIERKVGERVDFEFDCRIVHPDGTIKYVHTVAHPVLDPSGVPIECVGSTIDVTERKRADEALRDSEERWKAAFENNPTMYFMVGTDEVVLSVNPFGAEQLGYSVEELTGAPVLKVIHETDRAPAQRTSRMCLDQLGRAMSLELRMVRKDGSTLWVRKTARAMRMKDQPIVLIACEDITDRKRAEMLTAQVFESAPDGICIVGRDYRYRRSNPVYARRWGIAPDQVVGMHVSELLGADAFNRVLKPYLDRCFAGAEVIFEWSSEFRGRRYLSVSYSPLRSGSQDVEAALVIQRDLTAYMRASEALRVAQSELAHVNRVATMGQLTASIAHEVNQPIAATVIGAQAALHWLERQPPDLEALRETLVQIANDGIRAGEVVSRIRDLIKKAPPRQDLLEINEPIREVIELTGSEAEKNRVLVRTELAQGLPAIRGDRVQLQQVMLNLIINGIEAMSGASDGARELLISTGKADSDEVFVTVQDSGPGLEPAVRERIFEAFYTTKAAGLGMGLSICRSIIEAHGGRLWASANSARGATFEFRLPALQEPKDSGHDD
jgi:PAS domain S-box-containing protein